MASTDGVLETLTPNLVGSYDLVSGALMLLLAFVVLRAGFSKRVNQVFFLFLFLWGMLAVLYGLSWSTGERSTTALFGAVSVHFEIAFLGATMALAAIYPRRTRWSRHPLFWPALLAVPVAFEVAYLWDPHLFIHAFLPFRIDGGWARINGAGTHILYAAMLVAQLVLIVRFAQAYFRPTSEISRDQAKYVLAGTLAKGAHSFGFGLGILPMFVSLGYPLIEWSAVLQSLSAISGVVVGVFLLSRFLRRSDNADERRALHLFVGLFTVAVTAGVADAMLYWAGVIPNPVYLNMAPLWRLVGALFFAYGILRYQLLDIDRRLRSLLSRSLQVGAGTVVFAGTSIGLIGTLGKSPLALVSAQVVAGFTVLLILGWLGRAGQRIATKVFPGDLTSPAYVLERKLAIYRAALEGAFEGKDTIGTSDKELLRRLRQELDLTEREHAILEYGVRFAQRRLSESHEDALEPGAVACGKYRIEGRVGEGTFGQTFLAKSLADGAPVALKRIPASAAEGADVKVMREAKHMAGLRHPNIVRLVDVDATGGAVYIVMEYADGGSLKEYLERRGPLDPDAAGGILADVLRGLGAAHAKGVVHRDVKPANVLLTRAGTAMVADFGVATSVAQADATVGAFGSLGAPMGTPAYMSPEQARGTGVDARSDLYAAAAMFYEMLAGRTYLAFDGMTEFEIRGAILSMDADLPLTGVPEWANRLLERGLAKDPAARFQTADDMLAAIDREHAGRVPVA